MNVNIWNHTPLVAIWAGSVTLLCFAGGLVLKRKWTAALAVAVAGPVVLLPMAFAGGLGILALGETIARIATGSGSGGLVHLLADSVMLLTPFAMLGLYVRYERDFNRSDRFHAGRLAARARKRTFVIENRREMRIERRRNSAPKFDFPPAKIRPHRRKRRRPHLPSLAPRVSRHPRPVAVALPHPRG